MCLGKQRSKTTGKGPKSECTAPGLSWSSSALGLRVPVCYRAVRPFHEMKSDSDDEFQGGMKVSVKCSQVVARRTALDRSDQNPCSASHKSVISATSPLPSDLHSHH